MEGAATYASSVWIKQQLNATGPCRWPRAKSTDRNRGRPGGLGTWLVGSEHQNATAIARTNLSLAEMERRAILETLKRTGGKIYGANGAAMLLGVKPTTLYGKMRKHRIKGSRYIKHEVSP